MVIILTIKLPNISNNVLILNFAITQLRVPLIFILSLLGGRLIIEGLNKNLPSYRGEILQYIRGNTTN